MTTLSFQRWVVGSSKVIMLMPLCSIDVPIKSMMGLLVSIFSCLNVLSNLAFGWHFSIKLLFPFFSIRWDERDFYVVLDFIGLSILEKIYIVILFIFDFHENRHGLSLKGFWIIFQKRLWSILKIKHFLSMQLIYLSRSKLRNNLILERV